MKRSRFCVEWLWSLFCSCKFSNTYKINDTFWLPLVRFYTISNELTVFRHSPSVHQFKALFFSWLLHVWYGMEKHEKGFYTKTTAKTTDEWSSHLSKKRTLTERKNRKKKSEKDSCFANGEIKKKANTYANRLMHTFCAKRKNKN